MHMYIPSPYTHTRTRLSINWCCFYYFVRNSLEPLLEALCAQKLYFWLFICPHPYLSLHVCTWNFLSFFLSRNFTCTCLPNYGHVCPLYSHVSLHQWIDWYIYTRIYTYIYTCTYIFICVYIWIHIFKFKLNKHRINIKTMILKRILT